MKAHLYNTSEKQTFNSAMSVDIFMKEVNSTHGIKSIVNGKGSFYIDGKKIETKEDILSICDTNEEKEFVKNHDISELYFDNGINIFSEKHRHHEWKLYYIPGMKYIPQIIERIWIEEKGIAALSTYSKGR